MDDFAYVTHTTLASHGRSHYDPMRDMRPEWTLCAFEDGALVTSSGAWPFSMRFNGERIAVAGVTAVGTLPHKRRRGYLGRTMLASFVRQHEAGQAIAILHASLAAIYQRYGYAVVAGAWDYAIDPRDLRLRGGREAAAGTVRLSDKRELPLLKEIYRAYAGPRTGLLHRGEALWETGPLAQAESTGGADLRRHLRGGGAGAGLRAVHYAGPRGRGGRPEPSANGAGGGMAVGGRVRGLVGAPGES